MISQYNADERIIDGIYDLVIDKMDTVVNSHNAEFPDTIFLSGFSHDNVYKDRVSVQELMQHAFRFPALCFYIENSMEEEKNNAIRFQNIQIRFAIFTDGDNGATIIKRYLTALRELINVYYKDIDTCVFNISNQRWRYFIPLRYESTELRIAELDVQVIVEVRR